ncbi:hypothetical protein [Streptomyces sp. WAC00263]|uniref:hypothetical protein n=1 Tax=Streptomyces sp. WAC00263 TaxID=1917422 RepID=UPI0015EEC87E|nr:hypothetical protein [Streptomyces sp. WAC00263]
MTGLDAKGVEAGTAAAEGCARCVGEADEPGRGAVDRGVDGGAAVGGQLLAAHSQCAQIDAFPLDRTTMADHTPVPVDVGDRAVTGDVSAYPDRWPRPAGARIPGSTAATRRSSSDSVIRTVVTVSVPSGPPWSGCRSWPAATRCPPPTVRRWVIEVFTLPRMNAQLTTTLLRALLVLAYLEVTR